MQRKTWTRIIGGFAATALVIGTLIAITPQSGAAQSQAQPPAGDRAHRGGRGPFGAGGPGGRMGGPMVDGALIGVMRDLSDAQRQQVRAIQQRHADRLRPMLDRSRAARQALNDAIVSGNTGNFQALSIEIGNAMGELAYAQAQVESEIYGILTAEQKQQIAERRKQIEERRAEMSKRRANRTQ